jgi:hypothetical protein
MRRFALALLTATLTAGAAGCADVADETLVNDEDPLTSANGLSTNGLSTNGLSTNGLATNGLSTNGISTNGLSTNGLVMAALRDLSPTGDLTRMFFRYLVSCALGPNHSVSYTWDDATGRTHTEVNPGGMGLAPNWEDHPATQQDKELVSACLAARTNSKGIAVPVSLRAKNVSGLSVSASERSSYTYGEGAFWGNLFDGSGSPHMYSCSRSALNVGASTSQYLTQGRTCASSNCGVITYVGPCYSSDLAVLGQACYERGGSNDWVSACNQQKNKLATSSAAVLTTWLMP